MCTWHTRDPENRREKGTTLTACETFWKIETRSLRNEWFFYKNIAKYIFYIYLHNYIMFHMPILNSSYPTFDNTPITANGHSADIKIETFSGAD